MMKNLLLPLILCLAFATTQAQQGNKRMERKTSFAKDLQPNELASLQAKKMTLALDLTDLQENEIQKVLEKAAINRRAVMENRKKRSDMTAKEKLVMAESRIDQQIEIKRAMKNILSEDQYLVFEKMKGKRKKKRTGKMRARHS